MFLFQLDMLNTGAGTTAKKGDTATAKAPATDTAFMTTAAKDTGKQTKSEPKKAEEGKKSKAVLKGEDERNLAAALSEINNFVSKGDKATPEDKKRLEAKLEKVYGIVDYFNQSDYRLLESKNDIADLKTRMVLNGIKEKLGDGNVADIKALKEGKSALVYLEAGNFEVCLEKGKLVVYETLGLKEAIERGYYDGAREVVDGACKIWFADDDLPGLSIGKARYYRGQENYGTAAEHATEAIRLDPRNAEAYYLRGGIYYDDPAVGTYDKSIADYTMAIGLDSSKSEYYSERGDAYYKSGKYREAIADYKTAKEKAGDNVYLYVEDLDEKIATCMKLMTQGRNAKPATEEGTGGKNTPAPAATAQKPAAPTAEKKAPETEAKPASKAAALMKSAKFIPVEVDDVWADTQKAYERNNAGLDIQPLTRSAANSQFSGIIEYARANGWITGEQKDALMKGELPENFGNELALLKAMLRVSTQRGGMGHVKESFDAYAGKGVNEVLLALPEIAKSMPAYDEDGNAVKGKTIGARSAKFWVREFDSILAKEKIGKEALKAVPAVQEEEEQAEVPGTLDSYNDVNAFKQDWRVMSAASVLGSGVDYESFKNEKGMYAVDKAVAAAKAQVDGTEKKADPARNAACDGIEKMTGAMQAMPDKGVQIAGGIDSDAALEIAVQSGVLYRGNTRQEAKADAKSRGKDDVSGEVFEFDGRYYALSHKYARESGIEDPNVKKEGRRIANAPLGNPVVQEAMRKSVHENLIVLGVVDADGKLLARFESEATNKAISDYIGKSVDLTPEVRLQLAGIALASRQIASAKDIGTAEALVASEEGVAAAIGTKCANAADRNAAALMIVKYLNDNADSLGLKDDAGNFTRKNEILDAIQQYEVNAPEKTGPITAYIAKEKEQPPVEETPARETETPVQASVVAITQEAYDRMELVEKKREIGKFANGANDAETAKARDAIFGAGNMDNGKIEPRLKYLAGLPSKDIFEDGGSKMSAGKIVGKLEEYEKALAGEAVPGGETAQSAQENKPAVAAAESFNSIDAAFADAGISAELAKIADATKRARVKASVEDEFKGKTDVKHEDVVKAIGNYASMP